MDIKKVCCIENLLLFHFSKNENKFGTRDINCELFVMSIDFSEMINNSGILSLWKFTNDGGLSTEKTLQRLGN